MRSLIGRTYGEGLIEKTGWKCNVDSKGEMKSRKEVVGRTLLVADGKDFEWEGGNVLLEIGKYEFCFTPT